MLSSKSSAFWILISLAGLITGSVIGEAIGAILPDTSTTLKTFFSGFFDVSVGPFRIDLLVFRFGLEEIAIRLNLMSFIGLLIVGYLYRWF